MINTEHEQYIGKCLTWIDPYGNVEYECSWWMQEEPNVLWVPILENDIDKEFNYTYDFTQ